MPIKFGFLIIFILALSNHYVALFFFFRLNFNTYIGQSIYANASLLGPPMVDPTTVSHSFIVIYFVARFFRFFP